MAAVTFDTLKFANTLKAAGVPDKQAEAEAAAFAEVIQVNFKELVTKEDMALLAKDLRREMADLREEFKRELADFRADIKSQIATFQTKVMGDIVLQRWMIGAVLAACVGILIRLFLYPAPR